MVDVSAPAVTVSGGASYWSKQIGPGPFAEPAGSCTQVSNPAGFSQTLWPVLVVDLSGFVRPFRVTN